MEPYDQHISMQDLDVIRCKHFWEVIVSGICNGTYFFLSFFQKLLFQVSGKGLFRENAQKFDSNLRLKVICCHSIGSL